MQLVVRTMQASAEAQQRKMDDLEYGYKRKLDEMEAEKEALRVQFVSAVTQQQSTLLGPTNMGPRAATSGTMGSNSLATPALLGGLPTKA